MRRYRRKLEPSVRRMISMIDRFQHQFVRLLPGLVLQAGILAGSDGDKGVRASPLGSVWRPPTQWTTFEVYEDKGRSFFWKVHPIADWTDRDIYIYLKKHCLDYHPLWEQGYVSIGDVHTTRSLHDVDNPDEIRFFGLKRECGLHEIDLSSV